MLTHFPPADGDWTGYLIAALKASIPVPMLEKCIKNARSPMTRKDKAVAKIRKANLWAILHNLGTLYSPSPPPTPPFKPETDGRLSVITGTASPLPPAGVWLTTYAG